MDGKQLNKLAMYRSTATICAENSNIWNNLPAFKRQADALAGVIDTIDALAQAQESDRTGIAVDKKRITELLTVSLLAVAGALAAWGSENNNEAVRAQAQFSRSDIAKLRDDQIAQRANAIADEASKHDLNEYGVGPLVFEAFKARIAAYEAIVSAPRNAQIKIKTVTEAIREQFSVGDKILKERLDKLMEQFYEPQRKFYDDYHNARTIVDRGGGQAAAPASGTPAPQP